MSAGIAERAATLRRQLPAECLDEASEHVAREAVSLARWATSKRPVAVGVLGERTVDRLITHRLAGFALMGVLMFVVLWITIVGAAYPSDWLFVLLVQNGHAWLQQLFLAAGAPWWLTGLLVDGAYLGVAWVVAVMLPPMAIFFPLFALLEESGYLPRVAFNLDRLFARAGSHGRQSLSMMVGFGCNAAGVTAARVIDSPRERLIAVLTNNFSICNGRWPTLILMSTVFLGATAPPALAGVVAAACVVTVAVLGVVVTLVVSFVLSRTALRGEASVFTLELPPFRRPQVGRLLWDTLRRRTMVLLGRAVRVSAPAGVLIWLVGAVRISGEPLSVMIASALEPLGWLMGLNGVILLAFVLAIPANEVVIPTILLLTLQVHGGAARVLTDVSDGQVHSVLVQTGGWTTLTACCLMLFSLLHNPCGTTLFTIYRETTSLRWTVMSAVIPLAIGFAACAAVAGAVRAIT